MLSIFVDIFMRVLVNNKDDKLVICNPYNLHLVRYFDKSIYFWISEVFAEYKGV